MKGKKVTLSQAKTMLKQSRSDLVVHVHFKDKYWISPNLKTTDKSTSGMIPKEITVKVGLLYTSTKGVKRFLSLLPMRGRPLQIYAVDIKGKNTSYLTYHGLVKFLRNYTKYWNVSKTDWYMIQGTLTISETYVDAELLYSQIKSLIRKGCLTIGGDYTDSVGMP